MNYFCSKYKVLSAIYWCVCVCVSAHTDANACYIHFIHTYQFINLFEIFSVKFYDTHFGDESRFANEINIAVHRQLNIFELCSMHILICIAQIEIRRHRDVFLCVYNRVFPTQIHFSNTPFTAVYFKLTN